MAGPDFARIPRTIALLDNHTRRIIMETLAMQPLSPGALLEFVPVRQPTLSYHLDLLQRAHLIRRVLEEPGLHVCAKEIHVLARYAEEVLTPPSERIQRFF